MLPLYRQLLRQQTGWAYACLRAQSTASSSVTWDDWAKHNPTEEVKQEFMNYRSSFMDIRKAMTDNAKDPVQMDQQYYTSILGKSKVDEIQAAFKDFKLRMYNLDDVAASGQYMLNSHIDIAKVVDKYNEVEFKESKEWFDMLTDIEENIDTITIDEVLGRLPAAAEQIDNKLEDYWWRAEDVMDPNASH